MNAFLPALLMKVTLIFAAGLFVSAVMRSVSSSVRHLALFAALVCGLTLPALMMVSPRWDVGVLPRSVASIIPESSPAATNDNTASTVDRSIAQPLPRAAVSNNEIAGPSNSRVPRSLLVDLGPLAPALLWVLGLLGIIGWLAIGRLRLRKIVREAWPLTSTEWQRILDAVRNEAGVTRNVGLFTSSVVSTPLTFGTRAPVILLPDDALDWTDDHRRVVLRHEMAHVARGDSLTQLLAGFVCAIYWFHPFAWITERRLRAECERACDDRVVSLGTPATDYAAHLLEVARSARAFGAPGFLSVAMARPTQLEGRLLAVLNDSRQRVAATRAERVGAVAISALVMLPLAAFRPVERSAKTEATKAPTTIESPTANRLARGPKAEKRAVQAGDQSFGSVVYDAGKKFDSTFQLSVPARSGGTLYIDLKTGGGIDITPWDRPEVLVKARLSGRNWRETRVTLEPSNSGVTLTSDFTASSNNQSTSHDFDIKVPREFNVQLQSSGGSLSIAGVNGNFNGDTGGGEITLRSVNGRADLRTGGGEVVVENSNLDGSVSTGGGVIHIKRVNGHFNGYSGSGPVIRTESNGDPEKQFGVGIGYGKGASASASASASGSAYATAGSGPIIMTAAGGAISLPSAPNGARITTGGGEITIGSSGGAVYAQTGGGDVRIGPTAGSVQAITGAGDVDVDFRGKGSVDVATGKGEVTITAPRDLNANLELITAYTDKFRGKTRIISDWPVSVTETPEWDYSHGTPRRYVIVRQQIGNGGPLIRVNTVNGDIVLRKGN